MTVTVEDRIRATRTLVEGMRVPPPRGVAYPPGPNSAATMLGLMTGRLAPYQVFQRMSTEYGSVSRVVLARGNVYVLSDPELIWQAFVTDARKTMKSRVVQMTRPVLGNGLLTSEGEEHLRNRRLVQPAFHRRRIEGYAAAMVAAATGLSDRWERTTAGAPVRIDVVPTMSALTLEVVGRTLFGTDLTGDAADVGEAVTTALESFAGVSGPLSPAYTRLPTPGRRRLIRSADRLDRIIAAMIAQRRADQAAGRAGDDVMSLLLRTRDEESGDSLSDEQVRDEVMTLVLAGHETTAMALSWAIRDLTMNPAALAWLRAELDALPDRPLGFADLPALPRTHAIVAEAMRLHPPAWVIGRYAREGLELGRWRVPAGSAVLASQYAMHRHPRYWPEPGAFRPHRWIAGDGNYDERAPGVPRAVWFPFGFGARKCIGDQFAWVEAVLVLATLARRWTIAVLDAETVVPLAAVTMRPRGGMPARLTPR